MSNTLHDIADIIDNVKGKLTDQEYKNLMDKLKLVHQNVLSENQTSSFIQTGAIRVHFNSSSFLDLIIAWTKT